MPSNVICPPNPYVPNARHSRAYSGGPQIGSVTLKNPNTAAIAAADIYSGVLQFPAKMLILASEGPGQPATLDSILLHFKPLGRQYATSTVITGGSAGNEQWIPIRLSYVPTTDTRFGWYMKFEPGSEIREFWIDYGAESGQIGDQVTFLYSNSIDAIYWPNRGPSNEQ